MDSNSEYEFLTKHLDWLDDRIFEIFSRYITLITAIIGGCFYITSLERIDLDWAAMAVDRLFWLVSIFSAFLIIFRAKAWYRYRKILYEKHPKAGKASIKSLFVEIVMILTILGLCFIFPSQNPLRHSLLLQQAIIIIFLSQKLTESVWRGSAFKYTQSFKPCLNLSAVVWKGRH